jgi:hypothetical protein
MSVEKPRRALDDFRQRRRYAARAYDDEEAARLALADAQSDLLEAIAEVLIEKGER